MAPGWDSNGDDGWNDTTADTGNANDQYAFDNAEEQGISNGNGGGAGDGCRNCGQEGHFARECTEPRKMGPCFNCGEEGHSKADCTQPRVFKGPCNICGLEGHKAQLCPDKPKNCTRCKEQGDHDTKDCKNNFSVGLDNIPTVTEGIAWAKIVAASLDRDLDDFKTALQMLQKAAPELTYVAIEKKLRADGTNFYLIALGKECGKGYTFVNLQGKPDEKYCMAIFKSPICPRALLADQWPKSPEENLAKLAEAGIPRELGLPYCRNCESFGHVSLACEQEKATVEGPSVQCVLCGEPGHRVRDCTEPRKAPREPRTCKICGSEDHIAKECDNKPAMVCRNCEQEGHKASDCTEPRILRCRNCEQVGHTMKECPIPIDYEKMVCRHCGEKGHMSASRCAPGAVKKEYGNDKATEEISEITEKGDDGFNNENVATATGGDWENSAPVPIASTGGW